MNLIFSGQQSPSPQIFEYVLNVPDDMKEEIKQELEKSFGEGVDFEISKIKIRVFKYEMEKPWQ